MCEFNISFSGDAESLIARAKRLIVKAGGGLEGDATAGEFEASTPIGSIKGSYQVQEQVIFMTITKKPLLLSCSRIEKELSSVMR